MKESQNYLPKKIGAQIVTDLEMGGNLIEAVSKHKKYFKTILIITHVDAVKDIVDCMLEITKNEKDSKIVFGVDK